ncbi:MAG: FtsX-like permease family protein [Phycisphaeraceae bacterium]|nr:FtsX-like permease family protein [Phycisphaeraceae bacterium]
MSVGLLGRAIWRELRGTFWRVSLFGLCLAVGVAAVFVVNALARSMDQAVRAEARDALAADIAVISRTSLPDAAREEIERIGPVAVTRLIRTPSLVSRRTVGIIPGRSSVVTLNIIDGRYPLAGQIAVFGIEAGGDLHGLLDRQSIVVSPELLQRLNVSPGDSVLLGGASFRIASVAVQEVRLPVEVFAPGPRVFISPEGIDRTRFEPSMFYEAQHQTLLLMPPDWSSSQLRRATRDLQASLKPLATVQVESYLDGQPLFRENLNQFTTFLGLVAMLSLVVGGVGVAQAVRAWIASRMGAIAVLKCLGMRSAEIVGIYAGQLLVIAMMSAAIGVALGYGALRIAPRVLGSVIPSRWLDPWQPMAAAEAVGMGLMVALAFSLPPLLALLRIPPATVLRREAEPLRIPLALNITCWLVMGGGLVFAATWQGGSWLLGGIFAAGLATVLVVFGVMSWLLARLMSRVAGSGAGFGLRYSMANVARPGAQTYSAMVSIGLGVLVVLGLTLVERGLGQQLDDALPRQAPSVWMFNISADTWPSLDRMLQREGATRTQAAPVILGRLISIKGVSAQELYARDPGSRGRQWALTRNQRLSHTEELPASNRLVAGQWWDDSGRPQISIEEGFARDIEVTVGDEIEVELEGRPVRLVVSSLREVDWRSFELNFMMLVNDAAMEGVRYQYLATAHLPSGVEQRVQDAVAAQYPGVLLFQTRAVLDQVGRVLEQLAQGLRLLGGFVVLAGLAILGAAVSATMVRRRREVALLKTLGMTRLGVVMVFSLEYALLAVVAFAVGAAGAAVMAWAIMTYGMELEPVWSPHIFATALLLTVALMVLAGLSASLPALRARPHRVLQDDAGG